ncbi:MAG: sensor histidine kinase [Bacteroidetes bacterium]|nr:MAG: sensor histidine kinase [Bacteroidota bacterium]
MKRSIPAILILLALGGLIFIQFRLLMVGVRLEKQRFDHRIENALQNAVLAVDEDEKLAEQLGRWLASGKAEAPPALVAALDSTIAQAMEREGINTKVSFAITDYFARRVYLSSPDFDTKTFNFGRYTMRLGPAVVEWCSKTALKAELSCNRALHLDVPSLFTYLLGELDYLLWPSVACLLVIYAGLVFLIRTLRREERLNKIKNEFINNLTHELKTPSFSISLSSKMALEQLASGNPDKAREYLQIIRQENEKMKVQVEKVLELASLQSGRYKLNKSEIQLRKVIGEVLAEYSPALGQSKIELRIGEGLQSIIADEAHFKNVLRNLLDNAIKYGGQQVDILVEVSRENHFAKMSVSDSGPGIPPAHQKAVFDKFYRVPQADGHKVKGFGLGLSYVKQIVEVHGGKVLLESQPGQGTTVTSWWPLTE